MNSILSRTTICALALLLAAGAAAAQRDPALEGSYGRRGVFEMEGLPDHALMSDPDTLGSLSVRFRFSGAADSGEQVPNTGEIATVVTCTNFGSSLVEIEVHITNFNGSLYVGSTHVATSRTTTFSTHGTAAYFDDVIIGDGGGTSTINQGSGQVLTDGDSIVCTAQLIAPANARPVFLSGLEMNS